MSRRLLLMLVLSITCTAAAIGLDQRDGSMPVDAVDQASPVWNSATIWAPSLDEAGDALAGLVNQVDAACTLDVDPAVAINGASPDGTVYAFVATWGCPPDVTVTGATWNSASLWPATLAEAGSFFFAPGQLAIPANTGGPLTVANISDILHTFAAESLGISVEIAPGMTETVTVTAAPGEYTYVCLFHPDRMTGTLIVQ